jgi:hypothetical protein
LQLWLHLPLTYHCRTTAVVNWASVFLFFRSASARTSDGRPLHSVSPSTRCPRRPSNKRGRVRCASDSKGPDRDIVWMPYRRRERRCSRRWGGEMQHPIYSWNI